MRLHRALAVLLALALPTLAAAAPQGATREDRQTVRDLPTYAAGAQPDGTPASVDLRPRLPKVGLQTMNDCAAWAFGYAARSYLEAVDQGWTPDAPERIFSPTWIYNQVNQGVDQGSRIDRVLELLKSKGAATLATQPYLAKDFLTAPGAGAAAEAPVFRIAGYYVCANGDEIRAALADGSIVLCCVRTNPEFSSGRYALYSKELHARGVAARRPDQPHGFHAMAIVGYSDARRAFLFMNSWGADWGDDGFVWVAYDVLEHFNTGEVTDELMDFALVMVDRREPVKRVDGKYEVVPLESLDMQVFGSFAGLDPESGAERYRFTVSMRGQEEALARVQRVEWTFTAGGEERTLVSEDARSDFRLTFSTSSPTVQVKGAAALVGDLTATLSRSAEVPAEHKRALDLERVDAYYAEVVGLDKWRWTLLPRMSDADWRDLRSIDYRFDDNAAVPKTLHYEHDGGLPPKWSFESVAQPTYRTSVPVGGEAVLTFVDGSAYRLPIPNTPFVDAKRSGLQREVVWRPVGVDGDRSWYFYELRVRYPEAWHGNLLGVRVDVGNHVDNRSVAARAVGGPGPLMYVLHGYARRPFASGVLAYFREPVVGLGRFTPVTSYEIIPFGADVAWTVPDVADPTTVGIGHGYGIEYEDRYVGEEGGAPQWEYRVYLDGTANNMSVEGVTWTLPSGQVSYERWSEEEQPGPIEGYAVTLRAAGPVPVAIDYRLYTGEVFHLERTVQPHAPRNDALTVDLTDVTPEELADAGRVLAEAHLEGQDADLAGLREATAWSERSWGGVLRTQQGACEFNVPLDADLGRIEAPPDAPILFLLEYDDGSAIALRSLPHVLSPAPALPRLQLLARERFVGWESGVPRWDVALELRGDLDLLARLEGVEWQAQGALGATPAPTPADDPRRATLVVRGPCRVTATLRFPAEVSPEPIAVEAEVTTYCERPHGLAVEVERGWTWDPIERYGPNVDPWSIEYPDTPYRLRLRGTPRELERVREVRWTMRDPLDERFAEQGGEEPPAPAVTIAGPESRASGFAFRHDLFNEGERVVTPTVVYVDGREEERPAIRLSDSEQVPARRDGAFLTEVRDWGDVDGRRAALMIGTLLPGEWSTRLVRGELVTKPAAAPLDGLPAGFFERPFGRRELLVFEAGTLQRYDFIVREDWSGGFESQSRDVGASGAYALPSAIAPPTLRLDQEDEGDGSFWYLGVRAPETLLARVRRVAWSVWQGGQREVYLVGDRVGERRDAFELRLSGARPERIEAQLFGADGPLEGGLLKR